MIKLEITKADFETLLFLIRNFPSNTDYLDHLYNTLVEQAESQEN